METAADALVRVFQLYTVNTSAQIDAESLPMIFTKLIKLKNVYTENYPACTFLIALRTSWFSS